MPSVARILESLEALTNLHEQLLDAFSTLRTRFRI